MPNTTDAKGNQIRDSFRLPLWDWAGYKAGTQLYGVPDIVATQYLPGDKQINPLWQFTNPKTGPNGPLPMNDPSLNEGKGKDYRIPDSEVRSIHFLLS
jgi:hypothetical protein